jgi:hypothetical protein
MKYEMDFQNMKHHFPELYRTFCTLNTFLITAEWGFTTNTRGTYLIWATALLCLAFLQAEAKKSISVY